MKEMIKYLHTKDSKKVIENVKGVVMTYVRWAARFCFGIGIVWLIKYGNASDITTLIFFAMISFGAMYGWD